MARLRELIGQAAGCVHARALVAQIYYPKETAYKAAHANIRQDDDSTWAHLLRTAYAPVNQLSKTCM